MLKKYIAGEPEVEVVHTSDKDDATIAVAGVIYQDTDPELNEVQHSYHQKEEVLDVKLGDNLSEDQRGMLKDLIRRHSDVFIDMIGETDSAQREEDR